MCFSDGDKKILEIAKKKGWESLSLPLMRGIRERCPSGSFSVNPIETSNEHRQDRPLDFVGLTFQKKDICTFLWADQSKKKESKEASLVEIKKLVPNCLEVGNRPNGGCFVRFNALSHLSEVMEAIEYSAYQHASFKKYSPPFETFWINKENDILDYINENQHDLETIDATLFVEEQLIPKSIFVGTARLGEASGKKVKRYFKQHGTLTCEICGKDWKRNYGLTPRAKKLFHGDHHLSVSRRIELGIFKYAINLDEDMSILCVDCNNIKGKDLSLEEAKEWIKQNYKGDCANEH